MAEIGCAGILVVDTFCGPMQALPLEGQLVSVGAMPVKAGGCAANVAIDLAKQGLSVDISGCVGQDQGGEGLIATLKQHGIGCDPLICTDRFPTSETIILLVEGQDRRYLHSFGANKAYTIEDIDRSWLAKLKVFYLGGLFAMPAIDMGALIDLLKFCRESGVVTVVDVVVPTDFDGATNLRQMLPWIDWFLPNDTETEMFTGCRDPREAISRLQAWGASNLVVTLGKDGALAACSDTLWQCGAYAWEVTDPSGSGDAFASGVITGIAHGWDMPRTLRHASALGASATRAIGTTDSVFTFEEADRLTASSPIAVSSSPITFSKNMKFEMKMPDLATTDSPIKVLKWLKEPGQPVKRGEIVLEVETDKAAMEVEATVDGIWVETRAETGAEVGGGEVIAIIETVKTESAPESKPSEPSQPSKLSPPNTSAKPSKPGKGMFARNRAATSGGTTSEKEEGQSLSPARRTAARRLVESKQTIPHFYLQTSANAEAMSRRRETSLPAKPAWDAFFVKAVSTVIKNYPQMAARFQDDQLIPHQVENIGVAVDIDGDLFVVAVSDPSAKTVEQISQEIRKLVTELRSGDPQARKMMPGVMTISNLGGSNVESFTAIINPPESAILAIGKIMLVVVPVPDGGFAVEKRVNLTLSVDHRVANGRYAADFLGAIVKEIENL